MHDRPNRRKVVRLRVTPEWAIRRIRALAVRSENILFGAHAIERMDEREIFDHDVLAILRKGSLDGGVTRTKYGEYECKVVRKLRGSRDAVVVVLILPDDKLFVKTVEWEDLP